MSNLLHDYIKSDLSWNHDISNFYIRPEKKTLVFHFGPEEQSAWAFWVNRGYFVVSLTGAGGGWWWPVVAGQWAGVGWYWPDEEMLHDCKFLLICMRVEFTLYPHGWILRLYFNIIFHRFIFKYYFNNNLAIFGYCKWYQQTYHKDLKSSPFDQFRDCGRLKWELSSSGGSGGDQGENSDPSFWTF